MVYFAEVFPPGVKAFVSLRPNSAYSYLLIRSMPFAENISILQERSGGAVRVFIDIKELGAFKVSAFSKVQKKILEKLLRLVINIVQPGDPYRTRTELTYPGVFAQK